MGSFWSRISKSLFKDKREPIKGVFPRIKNIAVNNFRGILGAIVPIAALSWQPSKGQNDVTVMCLWMWMFWFFLLQPIAIPCTGMIPIFLLPMGGVLATQTVTKCYFNDNIALFILTTMLLLLLNNSGFDRRLALWFLCSGDACQFSGKRLVFKASLASFVLSMFSNRLIVTSTIIQYVTPIFVNLKSSYGSSKTEPNFEEMQYIINNAIQTSSSIGSIGILHSAYATLAFRSIWGEAAPKGSEYPDIFNYLQYSAFAFPLAIVMWFCNIVYHMLLINYFTRKPMSAATMNEVRNALLKTKSDIPSKVSAHEKLTVFFTIFALIIFFCRWAEPLNDGWAGDLQPTTTPAPEGDAGGERVVMRAVTEEAPIVKDAVVAALFVAALHLLPRSLKFLQVFTVEKKSQLKDLKPESAILWWRFVDQNTNYGYFFLFGSGVALNTAIQSSGLGEKVGEHIGRELTDKDWNTALFIICLLICILTNVMSGVAALVVFLPLVLNAGIYTTTLPWAGNLYLAALGVGVGATLGFMCPFMYTPAYFCHHVGKVPLLKMAKYSFLSVVICMLLLWGSLVYWAPYLWDPQSKGIRPVKSITTGTTTTPPPDAGPPPEERFL